MEGSSHVRLEILVALAIAVGLVGILVPILPGAVLILAAIGVWAWEVGGATAWAVSGPRGRASSSWAVSSSTWSPVRRLKDA